ncbi:ABC transporter ATP-binding protein [Jiangella mangrovi]|uniref:Branched-chain amino acid transport system ATP-binding protein n=1 Tax=Jiangella mangrovi TaxID=1524084 RepID=A0A7W9LNN9_9ACTN|nr:ABC transporter ATP-binding protein [Jiangella mangrovi]MBB5790469.1 branched-chain amino acid transport system ATP-binding protein [Jiangella mangrovi]
MLEVRELEAWYGQAQALWGIDVDVADGEVVALVGPNGAGKSTLVQAVAGLHRSTRGTIAVDGVDVARVPAHRVGDHGVALVPEGRRVFARMTVHDNLVLGAYRRGARPGLAAGLERVHGLFPRLAERSSQLAGSLSGGEQQMLAIGRALLAQPRLLLMDEPSLGLAPVVVDEVFDAIRTINADGVSVLLVEQDVERALEVSARGYVLAEGRIVASGSAAELTGSALVRKSVLGL